MEDSAVPRVMHTNELTVKQLKALLSNGSDFDTILGESELDPGVYIKCCGEHVHLIDKKLRINAEEKGPDEFVIITIERRTASTLLKERQNLDAPAARRIRPAVTQLLQKMAAQKERRLHNKYKVSSAISLAQAKQQIRWEE